MIIKALKGGGIEINFSEDEAKLSDEKFNNIVNKVFEREKFIKTETTKRIEFITNKISDVTTSIITASGDLNYLDLEEEYNDFDSLEPQK